MTRGEEACVSRLERSLGHDVWKNIKSVGNDGESRYVECETSRKVQEAVPQAAEIKMLNFFFGVARMDTVRNRFTC